MKNNINEMRNYMFAALARLSDKKLTAEKLKGEIAKSKAIAAIGKVVVESAKTEIAFAKLTGQSPHNAMLGKYQKRIGNSKVTA